MSLEFEDETYQIIGACFEVHKQLGHGFVEPIYQDALEIEFSSREIPFFREYPLNVYYKENQLKRKYFADFICYGKVIVELKALNSLHDAHFGQLINYLKASDLRLGLLVNFGCAKLTYKRIIL